MRSKYVQDNMFLEHRCRLRHTSDRQKNEDATPYPASHRIAVRNKIVHSARRLFNRHGFDNVSINQIMAGAGLTHGGFYSYFSSKSDLYTEVLGCFFTDPSWKSCWEDVEVDLAAVDAGAQVVRAYLSRQHFAMVRVLERTSSENFRNSSKNGSSSSGNGHPRATAQATAALCVGGMVVARAMLDRALADELRNACMAVALQLGGWDRHVSAKDRNRACPRTR